MASKKFNADINVTGSITATSRLTASGLANLVGGAVIDPESSDPASPTTGQMYYNTAASAYKYYNSSSWITFQPSNPTLVTKTSSYVLGINDYASLIRINNNAATLVVPASATTNFPIGTQINLLVGNSVTPSVAAAANVTLQSAVSGNPASVVLSSNTGATLIKVAANTWTIIGSFV